MQRLIEFAGNHPYLVSAAAFMFVVVIVSEIRTRVQGLAAIAPQDAVRLMNQGALVLDVRGREPYAAGHIGEARHLPFKDLANSAETLKKFKEKPIVTYCDTGSEGGAAARELRKLGFGKAFTLRGGLAAWQQDNLPLVRTNETSPGKSAARK
jgi:rhodanese-related sulfurtransferase